MLIALMFLVAVIAGPMPVFADQAPVKPRAGTGLGSRRPAQAANPYARLFEPRGAVTRALPAKPASPDVNRAGVCGTTIIEAPPFFDQQMKAAPPKDAGVRYLIRGVEPTTCDNK